MYLYLARQPIFNQKLETVAYELLYRTGDGASNTVNPTLNPDAATSSVVINAVLNIGLENITGDKPAMVNVTHSFLLDGHVADYLSNQFILEVLETTHVDDELVRCVREYKEKGFQVALDDFEYRVEWEPLVAIADIIKLDVLALGEAGVRQTLDQVKGFTGKWLAEKVENYAEFDLYRGMGFDYFQGYFLSKPCLIKEKGIPDSKMTVCRLLSQLARSDVEPSEVADTIMQDARLAFKLLKLLNSAAMGLPRELDSVKQAIIVLGLREMKRWAMLLAVSSVDGKPHELLVTALVRSRMCQLLAERMAQDSERAFTVGLLSLFDVLMDMPVERLFDALPFHADIRRAVLAYEGSLGGILSCVLHYEKGDWQRITCKYNLDFFELYIEALSDVRYGSMLRSA
ncbi:MAG: HDOD domain-containing protein [Gammaproteobacteria bacterium]